MKEPQLQDTIVALASPRGKSGICVLRLSGPDSIAIAAKLLPDPARLWSALGHSSIHTTLLDRDRVELDDAVLTIFRAPHSFTGEEVVEISGHGSEAIAESILQELVHFGARIAEAGEFSRRALFHGKLDLEELELIQSRIESQSPHALRGSNLAIHEKFARLRKVYQNILALLAEVNAELDFGDSDNIRIPHFQEHLSEATSETTLVLESSRARSANTATFTVALTGPPNVGKSSLFNALVNFQRSIVSEVAGTTRDYVEAFLDLDGVRLKLIDTAGHRTALDQIEAEGIALGQIAAVHAELTLRITDPTDRDPAMESGVVLVHNKADLDHHNSRLSVSALSGLGLDSLRKYLREEALLSAQDSSQLALSLSERAILQGVQERLVRLSQDLTPDQDLVLIAEDLRTTIAEIGSLLGVNISEDALNLIFASMCIGK